MRSILAGIALLSILGCGSKNDGVPRLADPAQADPRLKAADVGAVPKAQPVPVQPVVVEDMPIKKKAKLGE